MTGSMAIVATCLASLSIFIHFHNYREMILHFFATHYWLLYKTDADDEIKYYRLSKNTKRQQENRPTNYREY